MPRMHLAVDSRISQVSDEEKRTTYSSINKKWKKYSIKEHPEKSQMAERVLFGGAIGAVVKLD